MSTFQEMLRETPKERLAKEKRKKAINSWVMYDWANSAFVTTVIAAVLPVYYSSVAASNLSPSQATAKWAFTTTIALVIVALLSPILGAMADFSGAKKRYFTYFVILGATGTAFLILVGTGDWVLASICYIVSSIGASGSFVFYDSLLPHIANTDEIDQVSSRGYAMGYLGGGIMLAINLAMIMFAPANLTEWMSRISFFMVAIWWLVFTIPFWRNVPEPPRRIQKGEEGFNPIQASFNRLALTFKDMRKFKELMKFIIAFWLYNNGIGTIIYMATIYGTELGFSSTTTIGTLLMVQFVAIPFAFFFGWLGKKMGTKRAILLSISVYALIAIAGYFLMEEWHFWALGFAVATVQGGSQALSRSLFGRMLPKSKSAEFFAFFSVSEKIAGTVGPLVFGLVSTWMGNSRLSIVSLIIFFISGGFLLTLVNEEEAIVVAQAEEKQYEVNSAAS
jgi:UMF1 family MFS transporter